MIGQVQTIDGDKKVLPLAGSVPVGNPVGSFLYTFKKLQPRNYLYCDGSTFDQNQYPALFMYLNSNVLPDYRECAMVGAEQNTTDAITEHDIFTQGEFKDDQFQGHRHKLWCIGGNTSYRETYNGGGTAHNAEWADPMSNSLDVNGSNGTPRMGKVTRGKRKAVYVYIKAVDGVDISDEDTFLDTVKNYIGDTQSYSTEETLTGGKWIDGKPIYRKCWSGLSVGVSSGSWQNLNLSNLPSIDNLVKGVAIRSVSGDKYVYNFISFRWYNSILYYKSTNAESAITDIVIEYTKA